MAGIVSEALGAVLALLLFFLFLLWIRGKPKPLPISKEDRWPPRTFLLQQAEDHDKPFVPPAVASYSRLVPPLALVVPQLPGLDRTMRPTPGLQEIYTEEIQPSLHCLAVQFVQPDPIMKSMSTVQSNHGTTTSRFAYQSVEGEGVLWNHLDRARSRDEAPLGSLQFNVNFNPYQRTLHVHLDKGENIRNLRSSNRCMIKVYLFDLNRGIPDCYCKPVDVWKTQVWEMPDRRPGTADHSVLEMHDNFELSCRGCKPLSYTDLALLLHVCGFDRFSRDVVIGHIWLPLDSEEMFQGT